MALARHQMARAARGLDPRTARYRSWRGGVFVGKPVRRSRGPGNRGGVVLLRAAGHPHDAFHPHGARLDRVWNVECPVWESRGDREHCLRVELPRDEERREGAHEDGDADGHVCSEDSADHGAASLPVLDEGRL